MRVQAEVSLYPLRTLSLSEAINEFLDRLRRSGLIVKVGLMSTQIEGESGELFAALHEAFDAVAADGNVVLALRVSNACPTGR
ncbi:MAG: thiamine-binding protein [Verrucomicrobia bacterium]|nr:thiamine-binding protein [Verrucomicrobiota bacterium]